MEKEVKSFLDSVVAKNTRKTYIRGLELLEEHMEKTISEIIDERREDFKSDDVTHRRRLDRMHAETLLRFSPACLAASTTSRSRYRQVDFLLPFMPSDTMWFHARGAIYCPLRERPRRRDVGARFGVKF